LNFVFELFSSACAMRKPGKEKENNKPLACPKKQSAPSTPVNGLYPWVCSLGDCYGYNLLWMLFFSQFLLKSFCGHFTGAASSFVFRSFNVSGPQLQVYVALSSLPWALKPVLGVLSDRFPILGFKKKYYLLISSLAGIMGFCVMGVTPGLTLHAVVAAMMLIETQLSSCDLLMEAKCAEKMIEKPERGPDLIAFLHGGSAVAGLVASACVGIVIDHLGPWAAYAICLPLACCIVVPTLMNCLEEEPCTGSEANNAHTGQRHGATNVTANYELVVISMLICVVCAVVAFAGFAFSPRDKFLLSVVLTSVVISMLVLLLRPEIGPIMAFMFARAALHPSTAGASFYFFTDTEAQYRAGPHFSTFFYTTGMGLMHGVCTLLGVWTYARFISGWRYRRIMVATSLCSAAASFAQILVFSRWNLVLGIPDRAFMLGESFIHSVLGQWMWIPATVLMSQCCPQGSEATMYALLAGTINLGYTLSSFNGAYLLSVLEITPTGVDGEEAQFDNLWKASLFSTFMALLTIVGMPLFIPDIPPAVRLLAEGDASATAGSPWERIVRHFREEGDGEGAAVGEPLAACQMGHAASHLSSSYGCVEGRCDEESLS